MAFCPQCGANVADGTQYVRNAAFNWQHNSRNNHNNLYRRYSRYLREFLISRHQCRDRLRFRRPISQRAKWQLVCLAFSWALSGVHNFYLGYTGKAVAQLLITLLTCGFGSVISGIWGLIEGIMILTGSIKVDGKNVPLAE